ncbi:hypothetical protein SCHPADRAFT_355057 [Schizopora paradoxa]|uniref:Uncharacterized protein n=1 Tax=Schizopora paradoxa TaxID=27342 RepID=A0A0H2S9N0_9AGAM|nr:hypothetical protein SCHPADRAFT_355057 [Schizopora paradoxa]
MRVTNNQLVNSSSFAQISTRMLSSFSMTFAPSNPHVCCLVHLNPMNSFLIVAFNTRRVLSTSFRSAKSRSRAGIRTSISSKNPVHVHPENKPGPEPTPFRSTNALYSATPISSVTDPNWYSTPRVSIGTSSQRAFKLPSTTFRTLGAGGCIPATCAGGAAPAGAAAAAVATTGAFFFSLSQRDK